MLLELRVLDNNGDRIDLLAHEVIDTIAASMAVSGNASSAPATIKLRGLVVNSKSSVAEVIGWLGKAKSVVAVSTCGDW